MENYEVDFLVNLLKKDKAVIEEALKTKESFDKLITEFNDSQKDLKIFKPEEYDKLIANTKTEALNELTDEAKIPTAVYNKIRANSLEVKEKQIAKKFDISDWKGIDDLIDKISQKTAGNDEKDQIIEGLKKTIKEDDEKHLKELADAKNQNETYIINDKLSQAISTLSIEATDEAGVKEAQEIIKSVFGSKYKLSLTNGILTVSDMNGKVLTDKVGDPRPLKDVLNENIPSFIKLKSLEGGRGDDSTKTQDGLVRTYDDFVKLSVKKGLKPNSPEQANLLKEVRAANPDFVMP
jgi:hypothetical protein